AVGEAAEALPDKEIPAAAGANSAQSAGGFGRLDPGELGQIEGGNLGGASAVLVRGFADAVFHAQREEQVFAGGERTHRPTRRTRETPFLLAAIWIVRGKREGAGDDQLLLAAMLPMKWGGAGATELRAFGAPKRAAAFLVERFDERVGVP